MKCVQANMKEMMKANNNMSKQHQLWLTLSALGDGNIFAVLPELIENMLYSDISLVSAGIPESFSIVFPSDSKWQNKIYLQLVEKQRQQDALLQAEG